MIADRTAAKKTSVRLPGNSVRFPALDGIRAVAFFAVFLTHYRHLAWAWGGVNAFFVLSGFLITGILWDTRDRPHAMRAFYIRRTLRIFPLYWGVFLVLLLLTPICRWQWSGAWLLWPLYVGNFVRLFTHADMSPHIEARSSAQRD